MVPSGWKVSFVVSILLSISACERYPSYFLPLKCSNSWGRSRFRIKQVPGDGSCLFNAIAVSAEYINSGKHLNYSDTTSRMASNLRRCAVDRLSNTNCPLLVSGRDITTSENLLTGAAQEFNVSPEEYLELMKEPHTWGGGPEIVALSNFLKRPIYVYTTTYNRLWPFRFQIKKQMCFGPDIDDGMSEFIQPICILYTDGRFPLVKPWKDELNFDHFLALFDDHIDRLFMDKKSSSSVLGTITSASSLIPSRLRWRAMAGYASKLLNSKKLMLVGKQENYGSERTCEHFNNATNLFNYTKEGSDYILKSFIENCTAFTSRS